jgi:hypothetical protein
MHTVRFRTPAQQASMPRLRCVFLAVHTEYLGSITPPANPGESLSALCPRARDVERGGAGCDRLPRAAVPAALPRPDRATSRAARTIKRAAGGPARRSPGRAGVDRRTGCHRSRADPHAGSPVSLIPITSVVAHRRVRNRPLIGSVLMMSKMESRHLVHQIPEARVRGAPSTIKIVSLTPWQRRDGTPTTSSTPHHPPC